jgi:hypothetical protein
VQVAAGSKFVDLGADSLDTVRALARQPGLQSVASTTGGLFWLTPRPAGTHAPGCLPAAPRCQQRLTVPRGSQTRARGRWCSQLKGPESCSEVSRPSGRPIPAPLTLFARTQPQVEIMMSLEETFGITLDEEGACSQPQRSRF